MGVYNFSIVDDFPNQLISATCLDLEILASTITANLDGIFIEVDDVTITFTPDLTIPEEGILDSIISTHDHICPAEQESDEIEKSTDLPLIIQEDDIAIVPVTDIINFEGNVNVINEGNGKATVNISGSGTTWGNITGILSNQADLQTELDGKMNINADNSSVDTLFFKTNLVAPVYFEGSVFYDKNEHTVAVYNDVSDITHQLGQETLVRIFNNTGTAITDGNPVYINGAEIVENRPTVALAKADVQATAGAIGLSTHTIADQTFGYVTLLGLVNGLNTSAFSSGDTLFLSKTVAGGLTNVAPSPGDLIIQIGNVAFSDTTNGRILVNIVERGEAPSTLPKEAFFRPERVNSVGDYKVKALGQGGSENFTFTVPIDFVSLVALEWIFSPTNTIAAGRTLDLNSDYGTIGEIIQNNSESSLALPIIGNSNTFTALDISSVFSNITGGDVCGVNINLNNIGTPLEVFGIRIRYQ